MTELHNRTDYTRALQPDGVAVLMGMATWCGQCKSIAPKLHDLARKYPDARFYYYNTEKAEDIAQELGARTVPSFSVFKDGFVADGVTGNQIAVLERMIQENYEGRVVEGQGQGQGQGQQATAG